MIVYASSKEHFGFPSQVYLDNNQIVGAAPLKISFLPYESLGLKILSPSLLTEKIKNIRKDLKERLIDTEKKIDILYPDCVN